VFKQFKPREISPTGQEEISRLFQKGDYHNAVQQCKKAGYKLSEFQNDIEAGALKLLLSRRPSEILSFIHKHSIHVQYDVTTLLKAAFDFGDYAGFLKNAYRFNIHTGIDQHIDLAIEQLKNREQNPQAEAWEQKFGALREQSKR